MNLRWWYLPVGFLALIGFVHCVIAVVIPLASNGVRYLELQGVVIPPWLAVMLVLGVIIGVQRSADHAKP